MSVNGDGVAILPVHESWDLLKSAALGRLVTSVDGRPEIFPVNFVVQRRTILIRTAEGTKLISAAINNHVVFEADATRRRSAIGPRPPATIRSCS